MDQVRLDPQDKLTLPHLGHVVNKTPSLPQDKKVPYNYSCNVKLQRKSRWLILFILCMYMYKH